LIYVPPRGLHDAQLVESKACVWTAPDWLEVKVPLATIWKYRDLKHLFHVLLEIPDSDVEDILEELEAIRKTCKIDAEKVSKIYHNLWREVAQGSGWETLR
jgi:hypothetical protein